jgi:hypothetical protein
MSLPSEGTRERDGSSALSVFGEHADTSGDPLFAGLSADDVRIGPDRQTPLGFCREATSPSGGQNP